jgi:long-chain fatty acid transport protein
MNARSEEYGLVRGNSVQSLFGSFNLSNLFNRFGGRLSVLAIVLILSPTAAFSLGVRIPNQDAESTAKGNAVIATADNPSAIYYNPAGIIQIEGPEAQFGLHVISVNSHFEAASGGSADTKFEIQAAPQIYCVLPLQNAPADHRISLGLGVFAPYGLGLQWPGDASLRNKGIEGRLLYASIAPVGAVELLPGLSFAVGPTFNYSTVKFRTGVGIVPDDTFRFTGHGTAIGAKLGVRWQPCEEWAFGASWNSPTTVNYDGGSTLKPETAGKRGTKASLDFPQFVMAGISFRPTPHWNLEVGMDWTDWDTLNTTTFAGTAIGNIPFPFNWRSTFMVYSGIKRSFDNGYWVAGGYFYSPNSTTDRDFSPIIPDTDLHVGSLGFGHKGKRWDWALSGQIITGPAREVHNGNVADGKYNFFNQAVNMSITYHF